MFHSEIDNIIIDIYITLSKIFLKRNKRKEIKKLKKQNISLQKDLNIGNNLLFHLAMGMLGNNVYITLIMPNPIWIIRSEKLCS